MTRNSEKNEGRARLAWLSAPNFSSHLPFSLSSPRACLSCLPLPATPHRSTVSATKESLDVLRRRCCSPHYLTVIWSLAAASLHPAHNWWRSTSLVRMSGFRSRPLRLGRGCGPCPSAGPGGPGQLVNHTHCTCWVSSCLDTHTYTHDTCLHTSTPAWSVNLSLRTVTVITCKTN